MAPRRREVDAVGVRDPDRALAHLDLGRRSLRHGGRRYRATERPVSTLGSASPGSLAGTVKRIPRAALLYLVIGAAVLFVGIRFSSRSPEREEIDLSEFRQAIDDGEVATAEIKDRDHEVVGKLADDTEYKVAYPAEYADELVDELHDADPPVEVTTDPQSDSLWTGLLFSVLPIVLLIGAFLLVMNVMQGGGRGRHAVRQVARQAGVEGRAVGHVRRRRRLRRGGRGAAGDQGVPAGPRPLPGHRRPHPQGRAALRPARHRQDAARPGRRRRGRGAVLPDLGLRLRRDVRRRRRQPGPRPVREGQAGGARPSCSSTRSTPSAATAAPAWAAATTSASRRSTSCSSRWTASTPAPA